MWPFKKKTASLHYEIERLDALNNVISSLSNLEVLGEDMDVVGGIDIVTFNYKVDDTPLTVAVENISGIDVVGSTSVIESIDLEMTKK